MTEFDKLLKAAYDAGYSDGSSFESGGFDEWRATLSGLDVREDPGPIGIGDWVRIARLPEEHPCHRVSGRILLVLDIDGRFAVVDSAGMNWAVPLDKVTKVVAP